VWERGCWRQVSDGVRVLESIGTGEGAARIKEGGWTGKHVSDWMKSRSVDPV
jgi:hypothetical protein